VGVGGECAEHFGVVVQLSLRREEVEGRERRTRLETRSCKWAWPDWEA
jgi:hypothetical protein